MTEEQLLYEGEFLRVKRRGHWEYVERVNARAVVVIVAVTDARELVLVEQPRLPVNAPVIELPAGLVGDIAGAEDESLATAAGRELEEETGYRSAHMTQSIDGPPSAGLANEHITFFLARGLIRIGAGGGDASEDITPHTIALNDVAAWLEQQRQRGAQTFFLHGWRLLSGPGGPGFSILSIPRYLPPFLQQVVSKR